MNKHITQVTAHVPYLRRFARALTGSQEVGDTYALASLEAALMEPPFDGATSSRLWLYRALVTVWERISGAEDEVEVSADPNNSHIDLDLTAVAPLPRAAFLLQSMEEFDTDQVAVILRRPASDVKRLIDQAGEELAAQISTDVPIVEDEPPVAMDVANVG